MNHVLKVASFFLGHTHIPEVKLLNQINGKSSLLIKMLSGELIIISKLILNASHAIGI